MTNCTQTGGGNRPVYGRPPAARIAEARRAGTAEHHVAEPYLKSLLRDAADLAEALEGENARLRDSIDHACRAFGAPGDWGYNSREGEALFELHKVLAMTRAKA